MNRNELIIFFSKFDLKSKEIHLYYRKKEEWILIPKFDQNGTISIILEDKIIGWYNQVRDASGKIINTLDNRYTNSFLNAFYSISLVNGRLIEINVFSDAIMLVYSSILVEGKNRKTLTIDVYRDYYFKTEELKKIINQDNILWHDTFVNIEYLEEIYKNKSAEELQIINKTQDQILIENLMNSKLTNHQLDYNESEDFIYKKRELNLRIRNKQLVAALKFLYDNVCQICDDPIIISENKKYSEIHHLKPLGGEHKGNDSSDNMICVCPNCHIKLDYGAIEIKHNTFKSMKHTINSNNVEYHNIEIYNIVNS